MMCGVSMVGYLTIESVSNFERCNASSVWLKWVPGLHFRPSIQLLAAKKSSTISLYISLHMFNLESINTAICTCYQYDLKMN